MSQTSATRFPVLFLGTHRWMHLLGFTADRSYVDVGPDTLAARMGWGFDLRTDRARIRAVRRDHDPVRGWGVHGWRGTWLLNGASRNLVRIDVDPPVAARTGPFPIRVSSLRVAVVDPDGLVAALQPAE